MPDLNADLDTLREALGAVLDVQHAQNLAVLEAFTATLEALVSEAMRVVVSSHREGTS